MTKVLLVEDDVAVQTANKVMLTSLGMQVDVASTGNEGLSKAKSGEDYAIFFIDLGLPDILGYEVLSGIREEKGEAVPVIAITGYTGEDQKQKCLEAGANEVLHKPVMVEGFQEILMRYQLV